MRINSVDYPYSASDGISDTKVFPREGAPENDFGDMPDRVRVGPFIYWIEDWPATRATGARRFGEFSPIQEAIRIRDDLPPARKAEVLLHEVLHAAWDIGNLTALHGNEEDTIAALSPILLQIIGDNRELIEWIGREATPHGAK